MTKDCENPKVKNPRPVGLLPTVQANLYLTIVMVAKAEHHTVHAKTVQAINDKTLRKTGIKKASLNIKVVKQYFNLAGLPTS